MISNWSLQISNHLEASSFITMFLLGLLSNLRSVFFIYAEMSFFCSTKVTLFAPLESASMPRDPLPANKSRHLELGKSESSQLNRVSFILFPVGRISSFSGKFIFRPRHLPLMMRMFCL